MLGISMRETKIRYSLFLPKNDGGIAPINQVFRQRSANLTEVEGHTPRLVCVD